jgi:hypothetical protein
VRRGWPILHQPDREVTETRGRNAYPLVIPVSAARAVRSELVMQRDGEPAWVERIPTVFGQADELDERRAIQFRCAAPHLNVVRHPRIYRHPPFGGEPGTSRKVLPAD